MIFGWTPCLQVLLLAASPQEPAPLPEPKPIVVRPMPQPGQFRPVPKAPPDEAPAPPSEAAGSSPEKPAPKAKEAVYGSTPVPWTKGSTDPEQFPKGIPRVPGAWREAYSMGPQTAAAYYLCAGAPGEIAQLYLAFAAQEKWDLVSIPGPALAEERIVIARKGDWSLRVDAAPRPLAGGTEVFVTVSLKALPPKPKAEAGKAKP